MIKTVDDKLLAKKIRLGRIDMIVVKWSSYKLQYKHLQLSRNKEPAVEEARW